MQKSFSRAISLQAFFFLFLFLLFFLFLYQNFLPLGDSSFHVVVFRINDITKLKPEFFQHLLPPLSLSIQHPGLRSHPVLPLLHLPVHLLQVLHHLLLPLQRPASWSSLPSGPSTASPACPSAPGSSPPPSPSPTWLGVRPLPLVWPLESSLSTVSLDTGPPTPWPIGSLLLSANIDLDQLQPVSFRTCSSDLACAPWTG